MGVYESTKDTYRKSRHLYDLAMMMGTPIALNALSNDELWSTIHLHRTLLTHVNGVDYSPDIRKRICLVPPASLIETWKKDYNDMRPVMIYGASPTFEQLIQKMEELEQLFRFRDCH